MKSSPETSSARNGLSIEIRRGTKRIAASRRTRTILEDLSLTMCSGEFIGVLGASGSGKSTFAKALVGQTSLSEGSIEIDGQICASSELSRDPRIAYLPQDVVIHESLTPFHALNYVARLKEIDSPEEQVETALARVGLSDHARTPICRLSGGQRQRAALAAELLGDPGLIVLDEATSGLDPATEAEMMKLFRTLAREGRVVVCITHSPGSLFLCDRLICLHEGTRVFDGSPKSLMAYFTIPRVEMLYARLATHSASEWKRRFESSEYKMPASPSSLPEPIRKPQNKPAFGRQIMILTKRYLRLQFADFRALALQLVQSPAIAFMIALAFGSIEASFAERAAADTKLVLFVMTLAVLWCSGTASAREVVKELPIVRHELRFGLQLDAYLVSKLLWLGFVTILQSGVMLFIVRHFTKVSGPADLQMLALGTTAIVGVALGLMISTISGTSERAMTILPVVLIGLAIFSDGLARLSGVSLGFAWISSPAYWSLDALKSPLPSVIKNATYPGTPGTFQTPILGSGGPIPVDIVVLFLQGVFLMFFAWATLRWTLRRESGS